jgi:tetratricopeptide (TPR) repeat protein
MTPLPDESPAGSGRWPSRRWRVAAGLLLIATAMLAWSSRQGASVPQPDLRDAYPGVREALEDARRMVLGRSQSATLWGNYGLLLVAHGYDDEAIDCWREAHRLAPDEARWTYHLGDRLQFRDPVAALQWFEQAAALTSNTKPQSLARTEEYSLDALADSADHQVLTLCRLAEARLLQNQLEPAVQAAERARTLARGDARPEYLLARIALAKGDPDAARRHVDAAVLIRPDQREVRELQAQILNQLGAAGEARQVLKELEQLTLRRGWPDPWLEDVQQRRVDPHWKLLLAQRAHQNGDLRAADALLTALLSQHPEEAQFAVWWARVKLDQGFPDEVVRQLDGLLPRHPQQPELLALRGTAHLLNESWQPAIADYRAALNVKPDLAGTWSDLAFALHQAGELEEAGKAARAAVRLAPELTAAWVELTRILIDRGDQAAARQVLENELRSRIPARDLEELERHLSEPVEPQK